MEGGTEQPGTSQRLSLDLRAAIRHPPTPPSSPSGSLGTVALSGARAAGAGCAWLSGTGRSLGTACSRAGRAARPRVRAAGTHGQVQLDGVHGLVEGPGKLVLPERLHHHVLHVLQLVGLAAGLRGVGHLRRGRVHGARGHRHPWGGGRRRSGHPRRHTHWPSQQWLGEVLAPSVLPAEARHPGPRPDQAAPAGVGEGRGGHLRPAAWPSLHDPRRACVLTAQPLALVQAVLTCHTTTVKLGDTETRGTSTHSSTGHLGRWGSPRALLSTLPAKRPPACQGSGNAVLGRGEFLGDVTATEQQCVPHRAQPGRRSPSQAGPPTTCARFYCNQENRETAPGL